MNKFLLNLLNYIDKMRITTRQIANYNDFIYIMDN